VLWTKRIVLIVMPSGLLPPTHDLVGMFLLGLLGTGHCLGMCGPIAVAIGPAMGGTRRLAAALLYNLGRIVTYVVLGAVVAAMGGTVAGLGGVARVQVALAALAGVLLGWFGLGLLGVVRQPLSAEGGKGLRLPGAGMLLRHLARGGMPIAALPLGLLLGFLPCGLSMAAISRAVSAGHAWTGALLVASFGAGTLPSMMSAAWAGAWLSVGKRRAVEVLAALLLIAMAVQQLARVGSYLLQ
jgi:sulfite exporter TauE/SafE